MEVTRWDDENRWRSIEWIEPTHVWTRDEIRSFRGLVVVLDSSHRTPGLYEDDAMYEVVQEAQGMC